MMCTRLAKNIAVLLSIITYARLVSSIHHPASHQKSVWTSKADGGTVQSRAGGGSGWGWGGQGAITLDPVSIISLLALGAFLINNILQLLQANAASGRSLDVADLDLPLLLSDTWKSEDNDDVNGKITDEFKFPSNSATYRQTQYYDNDGPSFQEFFESVGSLYYLRPNKRKVCIKRVVCNFMKDKKKNRQSQDGSFKTWIFDMMLYTLTNFVAPEVSLSKRGIKECEKYNSYCTDSIVHDARIITENKVYGHVSKFAMNFPFGKFFSSG